MLLEKKWLIVLALLVALGASATQAAAQDFLTTSTRFAVVESNGVLVRGNGVLSSTAFGGGAYEVRFSRKVNKCLYEASQGFTGSSGVPPGGQITVVRRAGDAKGVFITTENSAGTATNRAFHLIVHCP